MLLWGCAIVLLGLVGGQNLPDNILNEPDWGFQSYLNEDIEIPCNNSDLVVEAGEFIVWELPSGELLETGTTKFVLRAKNGVTNMHLQVKNVQDADAGVYLCHVYDSYLKITKRGRMLRGLNLGGPMYREPFEEYRYNLMVGGLAALALFVPLVTMCLVYKYRYQTVEQKREKLAARQEAFKHQRYWESNGKEMSEAGEDNRAYENVDETKNTRL